MAGLGLGGAALSACVAEGQGGGPVGRRSGLYESAYGDGGVPTSLGDVVDTLEALLRVDVDSLTGDGGSGHVAAVVLGYSAPFDGGGGVFYWDDACVDADNGGTILLPDGHDGSGRWRRLYEADAVNVRWFGAHPTQPPDTNALAIEAAIASEAGDIIRIPADAEGGGHYLIDRAIEIPTRYTNGAVRHVRVQGDGFQNGHQNDIDPNNEKKVFSSESEGYATGTVIRLTTRPEEAASDHSALIKDGFRMKGDAHGECTITDLMVIGQGHSGTVGFHATGNHAPNGDPANSQMRLQNVAAANFDIGWFMNNTVSLHNVQGVEIVGCNRGIEISGDCTDMSLNGVWISNCDYGVYLTSCTQVFINKLTVQNTMAAGLYIRAQDFTTVFEGGQVTKAARVARVQIVGGWFEGNGREVEGRSEKGVDVRHEAKPHDSHGDTSTTGIAFLSSHFNDKVELHGPRWTLLNCDGNELELHGVQGLQMPGSTFATVRHVGEPTACNQLDFPYKHQLLFDMVSDDEMVFHTIGSSPSYTIANDTTFFLVDDADHSGTCTIHLPELTPHNRRSLEVHIRVSREAPHAFRIAGVGRWLATNFNTSTPHNLGAGDEISLRFVCTRAQWVCVANTGWDASNLGEAESTRHLQNTGTLVDTDPVVHVEESTTVLDIPWTEHDGTAYIHLPDAPIEPRPDLVIHIKQGNEGGYTFALVASHFVSMTTPFTSESGSNASSSQHIILRLTAVNGVWYHVASSGWVG